MSSRQYKYVVRLFNSCDCEICTSFCDTKQEISEVIRGWLETLEDGDRIEFKVNA